MTGCKDEKTKMRGREGGDYLKINKFLIVGTWNYKFPVWAPSCTAHPVRVFGQALRESCPEHRKILILYQ